MITRTNHGSTIKLADLPDLVFSTAEQAIALLSMEQPITAAGPNGTIRIEWEEEFDVWKARRFRDGQLIEVMRAFEADTDSLHAWTIANLPKIQ